MVSMFDLFSDEATLTAFQMVVNKKRAPLREIRQEMRVPEEQATAALDKLVQGGLIEEVGGLVPDFNVYIPSAAGLAASRHLKTSRNLNKSLF